MGVPSANTRHGPLPDLGQNTVLAAGRGSLWAWECSGPVFGAQRWGGRCRGRSPGRESWGWLPLLISGGRRALQMAWAPASSWARHPSRLLVSLLVCKMGLPVVSLGQVLEGSLSWCRRRAQRGHGDPQPVLPSLQPADTPGDPQWRHAREGVRSSSREVCRAQVLL